MRFPDQFRLDGKTALITGASKGIGAAIARTFGEAGASVILSSRKQEALDQLASELAEDGIEAIGIAANVGRIDELDSLVEKSIAHYQGIDILVNNAAANPVFGPVEQTDRAAFRKIIDVNLEGPFELCKMVLPLMEKAGGGSIINISSIGGLRPESMLGIYSVSKAALLSLTKVLASEWGPRGIRVNAVCPGLIKTKFSEALWSNEAIVSRMKKQLPIPRIGQPEEIAGLCLFLASNASSYCTGGVFTADGGYTI
ncbi:MAG: glucose 1-dehydrogenase [Saprospiraceae bacterium]|nr:glucose 1-dehydrogenase [Saprospiraceae bacterium]